MRFTLFAQQSPAQENALVERLLTCLNARNDCRVVGPAVNDGGDRVPTIAFRFDGIDSGAVARVMDDHHIAIRFGDFHSRRLVEEMGEDHDSGVVRVSMVHYNTLAEVDRLCVALTEIAARRAA